MEWATWIGSLSTAAAVAIALFGQPLRYLFSGLRIRLRSTQPASGQTPDGRKLWFFHLVIAARPRMFAVHGVMPYIHRVAEMDPVSGKWKETWRGRALLGWRHAQIYAPARDIGPEAEVDLVCVGPDAHGTVLLHLPTVLTPNDFPRDYHQPCDLLLTVRAEGKEKDSPSHNIKIHWAGTYSADGVKSGLTIEMLDVS